MKNQYLNALILLLMACLLLPLAALPGDSGLVTQPAQKEDTGETFRIYQTDKDQTVELTAEEYLLGVLSAEISPETQPEAIKAQAVAAYTYAKYRQSRADGDYDLTDQPGDGQGYLDESARREKFGEKYVENVEIFRTAIAAVAGQTVTYAGAPIYAAYHAVSAGKTETAATVFGGDYPYLTAVESVGDLLSPDYFSTKSVAPAEFFQALEMAQAEELEDLVGEVVRSESGTVMELAIGEQTYTGRELRERFDLRSANFDLRYDGEDFVFTVRGYGHGVGMSQYGADYMASLGSTYREILLWYYPGCAVSMPAEDRQ